MEVRERKERRKCMGRRKENNFGVKCVKKMRGDKERKCPFLPRKRIRMRRQVLYFCRHTFHTWQIYPSDYPLDIVHYREEFVPQFWAESALRYLHHIQNLSEILPQEITSACLMIRQNPSAEQILRLINCWHMNPLQKRVRFEPSFSSAMRLNRRTDLLEAFFLVIGNISPRHFEGWRFLCHKPSRIPQLLHSV